MKHRIMTALVIALMLALTACGGQPAQASPTEAVQTPETAAPTEKSPEPERKTETTAPTQTPLPVKNTAITAFRYDDFTAADAITYWMVEQEDTTVVMLVREGAEEAVYALAPSCIDELYDWLDQYGAESWQGASSQQDIAYYMGIQYADSDIFEVYEQSLRQEPHDALISLFSTWMESYPKE